MTLLTCIY